MVRILDWLERQPIRIYSHEAKPCAWCRLHTVCYSDNNLLLAITTSSPSLETWSH
ncbi:hypothetical protein M378DRAFT_160769, partial [Amanita muscaria Koide BX008]